MEVDSRVFVPEPDREPVPLLGCLAVREATLAADEDVEDGVRLPVEDS